MPTLTDVVSQAPTTTAEALALYDSLPAIEPAAILGTWHGAEVSTGHPLDGMLEASGWWGKQFGDSESVHPLLFPTPDGSALWALNPAPAFAGLGLASRLPMLKRADLSGLISRLKPVLRARSPKARLRTTRYRGVDTATMVYDQLPINDVFRLLDATPGAEVLLGAMDLRGFSRPYFFLLQRDESLPVH